MLRISGSRQYLRQNHLPQPAAQTLAETLVTSVTDNDNDPSILIPQTTSTTHQDINDNDIDTILILIMTIVKNIFHFVHI